MSGVTRLWERLRQGDPPKSPRGEQLFAPSCPFSFVFVSFLSLSVGSAQPGFWDPWASNSNKKTRKRDSEKRSPKSNPCKPFREPFRSSKRDLRRKIRLLHFQEAQSGICNPYSTFGLPELHFPKFSDSCDLPSEQTLKRVSSFSDLFPIETSKNNGVLHLPDRTPFIATFPRAPLLHPVWD